MIVSELLSFLSFIILISLLLCLSYMHSEYYTIIYLWILRTCLLTMGENFPLLRLILVKCFEMRWLSLALNALLAVLVGCLCLKLFFNMTPFLLWMCFKSSIFYLHICPREGLLRISEFSLAETERFVDTENYSSIPNYLRYQFFWILHVSKRRTIVWPIWFLIQSSLMATAKIFSAWNPYLNLLK